MKIQAEAVPGFYDRHVNELARRMSLTVMKDPVKFVPKAVSYPYRYADALRARRQLRRVSEHLIGPADVLAFADHFHWGGHSLAPFQNRQEISWLLELLAKDPPEVILEIGTLHGGTLFLWSRVATHNATIICIDKFDLLFRARSPRAIVCRAFARDEQKIELLFGASSHDSQTRTRVEHVLDGRAIDFLFIDGDHSYEGVRLDFEMYADFVRRGGLVAFHDIAAIAPEEGCEVSRFWLEFSKTHVTQELVSTEPPIFGIGIYRR